MTVILLVPVGLLLVGIVLAALSLRLRPSSGDLLAARRVEQPLAHQLPYWTLLAEGATGVIVTVDLRYAGVLHLQGIDTDCQDDAALNQIANALHTAIQALPAHAVVEFHHLTDHAVEAAIIQYRTAARGQHPMGQWLVDEKVAALRAHRGLRRTRLYAVVSLPVLPPIAAARTLGFTRRFPSFTAGDHEDGLKRLAHVRDAFAAALRAAGLTTAPMNATETHALLFELVNPDRPPATDGDESAFASGSDSDSASASDPRPLTPPRRVQRGGPQPLTTNSESGSASAQTLREQLALTGVVEARDQLRLGAQLVRVLTLRSLPTHTEPALCEALTTALGFPCRVTVAIEALDSLAALDQLKRRRDQAHLLATLRERRNQEAEAQEADVAELIARNLQSSLRMVRVALTVVLSVPADAPDAAAQLARQTADVLRIISSLYGAQALVDEHAQLDGWLASLPANAAHGRRGKTCTSENAAHLALAWQGFRGSATPLVLVESGRGQLVGLDPFAPDLDNPNAFMAGTSGSGKSSTANYLLLNLLAAGAGALVLDVGGSYRRLLGLFGGDYFAVSSEGVASRAGRHTALNPFFPAAEILLPDGRLEERRAQFLQVVLERMVTDRARPELRHPERAVLLSAVTTTYQRCQDGAAGRTPLLGDLVTTLRGFATDGATGPAASHHDPEDRAIAHALARDLRVWTEGPAARLVNQPSSIALDTACAAFDLKGLEAQPDLQAVVLLILSGAIWSLVMRDPTARKVIVFDEVWRLLAAPASAALLAELYRTSRKYRASVLTISQSVEDFTTSPIAAALVNNSATTYLLKHRRGHDVVAAQFHLNARERHVFGGLELRRGEYTEALVLHGPHHFLARVVLSPLEYWMATTHPADLALEREVARGAPHLSRRALLQALARRFPRGADAAAAATSARELRVDG